MWLVWLFEARIQDSRHEAVFPGVLYRKPDATLPYHFALLLFSLLFCRRLPGYLAAAQSPSPLSPSYPACAGSRYISFLNSVRPHWHSISPGAAIVLSSSSYIVNFLPTSFPSNLGALGSRRCRSQRFPWTLGSVTLFQKRTETVLVSVEENLRPSIPHVAHLRGLPCFLSPPAGVA
ncbi:hypothetical protein BJX70DRAFT_218132 [Aspergillus crustosus]